MKSFVIASSLLLIVFSSFWAGAAALLLAAVPALAQYGGTPVGVPRFNFTDGTSHTAGKAFAVAWFKGRRLLLAPYHCLGPAGGYSSYIDPKVLPEKIKSVDVMNLQGSSVVATAGRELLRWACPVEHANGDLSGDMLAFELPARTSLPVLAMSAELVPAKTKVWVLTRGDRSSSLSADRYSGVVESCYRTALVVKMDQTVDAMASSGSPVVNDKGQLVGMMVGVMDDGRKTVCCIPSQTIYRRLLDEVGQ